MTLSDLYVTLTTGVTLDQIAYALAVLAAAAIAGLVLTGLIVGLAFYTLSRWFLGGR